MQVQVGCVSKLGYDFSRFVQNLAHSLYSVVVLRNVLLIDTQCIDPKSCKGELRPRVIGKSLQVASNGENGIVHNNGLIRRSCALLVGQASITLVQGCLARFASYTSVW